MADIKMSLSIILPGSVMFSKQECFKQLEPMKKFIKKGKKNKKNQALEMELVPIPEMHDTFEVKVEEAPRKFTTYKIHVRKNKPAKEVVYLTEEAYAYMVSNEKPYDYKGTPWQNLSRHQKIVWHCEQIAAALGGKFDTYQVLD